jgi:Regulator of chromosome condensation (RCC1) repeat
VKPHILALFALASALACKDGTGSEPAADDPLRPTPQRVVDVAIAFQSTCALTADGKLHCWGENGSGEFGDSTLTPSATPVLGARGMEFASVQGSMGTAQMCGLTQGGAAYCWGYNANGELGSGFTGERQPPVPVAGGLRFRALASSYHTCGISADGQVWCWGSSFGGQLGTGPGGDTPVPARIAFSAPYTHITTGMQFSCAIRQADGHADCWGWGGGMGSGTSDRSVDHPTPVSGNLRFTDISAGEEHVCAVADDGQAWCWGRVTPWPDGFRGAPERVLGGTRFVEVASASRTEVFGASCGRTSGGEVFCWHDGLEPVALPGNRRFAGLTGGHGRFCGFTPGGAAFCWTWTSNGSGPAVPSTPMAIPEIPAAG